MILGSYVLEINTKILIGQIFDLKHSEVKISNFDISSSSLLMIFLPSFKTSSQKLWEKIYFEVNFWES